MKTKTKQTLDDIVKIFTDPDALKKGRKMWSDAEPKNMEEAFEKIPSLPLSKTRENCLG